VSESLLRGLDRARHQLRKNQPYEAHSSAILAMFSWAITNRPEASLLDFFGDKASLALFAESFDDAIRNHQDQFLLPHGMEEARDRLMKVAGVHCDGRTSKYCTRDDGSWSALEADECPRCGYQPGDA
jgi:hypothetical protein